MVFASPSSSFKNYKGKNNKKGIFFFLYFIVFFTCVTLQSEQNVGKLDNIYVVSIFNYGKKCSKKQKVDLKGKN